MSEGYTTCFEIGLDQKQSRGSKKGPKTFNQSFYNQANWSNISKTLEERNF